MLQLSYLLRVFDRRLGAYLLIFGGGMELFALFGSVVAWFGAQRTPRRKTMRKWVVNSYLVACVALFITAFMLAGVGHKLSVRLAPATEGTMSLPTR